MGTETLAYVDFSRLAGKIDPKLHGSSYAPELLDKNPRHRFFGDLNLTLARTHDLALVNRGQRVVDTHFVFPLESLDPENPDNYYFTATDDLFKKMLDHGAKPYYRLGNSIEAVNATHYNSHPPQDFRHYARILAGIIRHYNHGWANGFCMGIPYWEIWNEPNLGPQMWTGTKEQFIEFFATVLAELKREFPGEKIGGPALTWPDPEWVKPLFAACRAVGVTPDFLSFHTYGHNIADVGKMIVDARKMLDEIGCPQVELHLNEWHFLATAWAPLSAELTPEEYHELMYGERGLWGADSAAYNTAMFTMFHDVPLAVSCYYGCEFKVWGLLTNERSLNRNYYSLKMMGQMVKNYPNRVKAQTFNQIDPDDPQWEAKWGVTFSGGDEATRGEWRSQWVLGATDASGKRGAILVTDYRGKENSVQLAIRGAAPKNWRATRLDQLDNAKQVEVAYSDGILTLPKRAPGSAVYLVEFDL